MRLPDSLRTCANATSTTQKKYLSNVSLEGKSLVKDTCRFANMNNAKSVKPRIFSLSWNPFQVKLAILVVMDTIVLSFR